MRRLAVIDLYGIRGTVRRRRLVLAEYLLSLGIGLSLGVLALVHGGTSGWLIGIWVSGIGFNYLALAIYALHLIRPGRLLAEVAAIRDLPGQARYYSIAQVRLIVPFLITGLAVQQHFSDSNNKEPR